MNNYRPHIIQGVVLGYKEIKSKEKTSYLTCFAVPNEEWEGGYEYIQRWLSKKPELNEEWRIFRNGFELTPFEPVERST